MKRFIGAILVSFAFVVAVHHTVAASPSQGIYQKVVSYDLTTAEFVASLRVNPVYGQPVTVYPVNTKLTEVPKDVVPASNSPPTNSPYTVSRATYYR